MQPHQYPPPRGGPPNGWPAQPPPAAYPPPGNAYPPPGNAYPPPGNAYPPPGNAYPPPGTGYPPDQSWPVDPPADQSWPVDPLPDQSWPDDPPPGYPPAGYPHPPGRPGPGQPGQPMPGQPSGAAAGRPGSVAPLIVGAIGAGIAACALLAAAVMALVLYNSGVEGRGDDDVILLILLVWTCVVAALLLVYSLGLIIAKRDSGRSGIVWISVATLPWTLVIAVGIMGMVEDMRDGVPNTIATLASMVASVGAGLAFLGMVTAMIFLGVPPGRRWLAGRVLARSEPLWPPAPLIAAKKRFTMSAFLGMGGCAAQLILTPLVTNDGSGRSTFLAVFAGILVVLVAVPLVLGQWGARLAFGGRRGGAHLARAAGVFVLFGMQPFLLLGVLNGLAGVFTGDAALPPVASGPLGALVTAVVMLALMQYVAGLAALADPRSEVYLRSGGRRAG